MSRLNEIFYLVAEDPSPLLSSSRGEGLQIWRHGPGDYFGSVKPEKLAGELFNCLIFLKILPKNTSILVLFSDIDQEMGAVLVRSAYFPRQKWSTKDLEKKATYAFNHRLQDMTVISYDGKTYSFYEKVSIPFPSGKFEDISFASFSEIMSLKPIPYLSLPAKGVNVCQACGCIEKDLKPCEQCKKIHYCSKECQEKDRECHAAVCGK
jgi:hypothetical protein